MTPPPQTPAPLLRATGLEKTYFQASLWSGKSRSFRALDGVDLELARGSCTALVGRSGSGKSTLGMCLASLDRLDAGEIWFDGLELSKIHDDELRALRPRIQLIFQDASGSLNPGFTAAELVEEPLLIQEMGSQSERKQRASEVLERLGIPRDRHACRPHEFSGGQRRRISLARALVLKPSLMILDEVFSGLDLTTSLQVLQLLLKLRAEQEMTLLFISHDLTLLAAAVDSVFVMQAGRIVEQGSPGNLAADPQHAHTRALFSAHEELCRAMAKGAAR